MGNIAHPQVTLLAHTAIIPSALEQRMGIQEASTDAETLTVYAGRSCYGSWNRPNEKTRLDADYLKRTLFEQGHWSIAEHASATLYFEGVSRAFTHEIIRHRHLSYSQLSQRFVNESNSSVAVPPAIAEHGGEELLKEFGADATSVYSHLVDYLENAGLPRKQAREAARGVLPNMTETRIVVTGNLRAWSEVIERRTAPDADAEMRQVMGMARDVLEPVAPAVFGGAVDQN